MSKKIVADPSYNFMTKILPSLYPKDTNTKLLPLHNKKNSIGVELYNNFITQTHSTPTQLNLDPFYKAFAFMCLVFDVVNILKGLGLSGDLQKTHHQQKIKITRDLYDKEFPPEKYAYTPIKTEKKEIIYNSNEIFANKIIAKLYNTSLPDEIKDVHLTTHSYIITPPIAILSNENKTLTRTTLIAPNMDTNWNSVNNFSKYIYYPLHTFQPSMLHHALAYFFIKNYDYHTSIVLNTLANSRVFVYSILNNIKLNHTNKLTLKRVFGILFELVETTSDYLNSIVSSIANVTGNSSRVDPRNAILLLASILKDQEIINEFSNSERLYEKVRNELPSGVVKDIIVQSTHISYTPQGEYTIVDEKTIQLTSYGQKCSSSHTKKISRTSVVQVIPLLRSKIVVENGEPIMVKVGDGGVASLVNSKVGISKIEKLTIPLPTTSWNDAKRISGALSNKIITLSVSAEMCADLKDVIGFVTSFNNASFSWSNDTKIARVKITTRGFKSTPIY